MKVCARAKWWWVKRGHRHFSPCGRGRRLPAVDGAQVNQFGVGEQFEASPDSAGGRDTDGRQAGPGSGQGPHCAGRERPDRPGGFLRGAPPLGGDQEPVSVSLCGQMAQPSVRRSAMADQNQGEVWSEVRASAAAMMGMASPQAARQIESSSSYADMVSNLEVKQRVDAVAAPLEQSYAEVLSQLHERNAVGVVAAVNDQIIWADLFASTALLQKYWPKLIRSYAAEALTRPAAAGRPDEQAAQTFLQDLGGRRETVESEPGVYRRREVEGEGFTAFQLTALLPGTGFDLHIAKMAD